MSLKVPQAASTRLVLPRLTTGSEPSADDGTLGYDAATNKIRIKTSSGWADLSGSGGGVTSFNTRTGAVTPQTGDYNATNVGLGNVTNDAQLKRAGSDWGGFTAQSGLDVADTILIERTSDGAKRKVTVADLLSVNGLWRGALWPNAQSFVTPGSVYEEFTTAPGAGSWWQGGTPFTAQTVNTSVGNIDGFNSTFSSSQPRVDYAGWRRSRLTAQFPYNNTYYAYAWPATFSTNSFVWCKMGTHFRNTSSGLVDLNFQQSLALWASDGAGHPTFNGHVAIHFGYRSNGTAGLWYWAAGQTNLGASLGGQLTTSGGNQYWLQAGGVAVGAGGSITVGGAGLFNYMGIQKLNGDYHFYLATEDHSVYLGTVAMGTAPAYVGVGFRENTAPPADSSARVYTPVRTVDFVRQIDNVTSPAVGYGQ